MFQVQQRQAENGIAVLALSGRLLLGAEGAQVEAMVRNALDEGARGIVFDFSALTHIDSTGIGRCISSLNTIMQHGGKLAIAAAAGQVRESFRVTQLDRVFRFFDDIPSAIAAVTGD